MSNLYQWEAKQTKRFEGYGDVGLSALLLLAAAALVLIALFVRSPIIKAVVAAYVFLP